MAHQRGDGQNGAGDPLAALDGDFLQWDAVLRVIGVLRRRWWLLGSLGLGAMLIAGLSASRRPVVYRATSTILLEGRPRVVDKVAAVAADGSADAERFANSQVHVLTSERMARKVEERLQLAPGAIDAPVAVLVDRASQLLTLSVDHGDPERARTIVNAFTDAYIASTVSDDTGAATDAARFLEVESKAHRARLEADERALYGFQRDNGLPASNFEESHRINSSTLQSLHAQAAAAFTAGVKLRAELEQLRAAHGDADLLRRLTPSSSNGPDTLHQRYATLVEQAAQYEARYGPQHPKMVETEEALGSVKKALEVEARTNQAALEARLRANASELGQLKAAIAAETQRALDLRQNELEYNRLKRKMDEDREAYEIVAKREKELEIQAGIQGSYVRRLDAASSAMALPRPLARASVIGLLVGLLLAGALAFLLELIDDTIRAPHEAAGRLHAPLLGFVAQIAPPGTGRGAAEPERAEYIVRYPRSAVAEQCHSVATTVYSVFLDKAPRAIALVSPASHDGKTLTCVNLAAALSARGKRVLLLDCDLRRGSLHNVFKLPRAGGLFELATGQLPCAAAPRQTFIPNVDVVTCGAVPDKVAPARVLELPKLRESVAAYATQYDLIVFDTPPVPMVTDVLVMRDLVDGVLGVFRAGKTSVRVAGAMERQLADHKLNFLGWVLNDVGKEALRGGYYRRYGYYASREAAAEAHGGAAG